MVRNPLKITSGYRFPQIASQGGNLRVILVWVWRPVFLNLSQSYTWSSKNMTYSYTRLNKMFTYSYTVLLFDFSIPSLLSVYKRSLPINITILVYGLNISAKI